MPGRKKPTIKRGRAPIRSQGSSDKRTRSSQMAMNRKDTRVKYEAREVESYVPSKDEGMQANKAAIDSFQKDLKPIRASQPK